MTDITSAIVFLFCAAFVVPSIVGVTAYNNIVGTQASMIEECEKNLPRNRTCKIIAVPVDKEKQND